MWKKGETSRNKGERAEEWPRHISILVVVLIMVNVSFSLCWIWMVKFRSSPGESEHRLKQAASGSRQGEAKQEQISLL